VSVLDPQCEVEIELHGFATRPFPAFELKISIFRDGLHIASCHDTLNETPLRAGRFISRFTIPANIFKPGMYALGIGAAASIHSWVWGSDVAALDFSESLGGKAADRNSGLVGIPYTAQRIEQNIVT
jgi:hypothetical protein